MKLGSTAFIAASIALLGCASIACSATRTAPYPAVLSSAGHTDEKAVSTAYKPLFNDTHMIKQWAYSSFSDTMPEGNEKPVLVAVLDTGIDSRHQDLAGRVMEEVDFSGSEVCMDKYGHGTVVAGIIAANANNGLGIAGLSPNALLLNVKVADDEGRVFASNLAKGIIWAADRGARVINVSLCIVNGDRSLEEAVVHAWEKGAVIVAAAGNCQSTSQAPGCYPHVISAGAVDQDGNIWEKSNQTDCVTVYAPGVDVYSTIPGNDYGYTTGTSIAAAHISAAAAELMTCTEDGNNDGRVNDEVSGILRSIYGR